MTADGRRGRGGWCTENLTDEWWNEQKGQEESERVWWMCAVVLGVGVKALIWKSQRLTPALPGGRAAALRVLPSVTLGMREMISGYLLVLSSWLRLNIRTSPLSRMWICKGKRPTTRMQCKDYKHISNWSNVNHSLSLASTFLFINLFCSCSHS